MKKILLLFVGLMLFLTSPAHAHRWEWAASHGSENIYIDVDSAVSVQELFALNDLCIQALFKADDGIMAMNFRRYNGTLYVGGSFVNATVLNLLNMSEAQEKDNRYRELRSRGASPGMANRILNRERGEIRDSLWRQYTNGLMTYGKNPDGSVNPVGAYLLCVMVPIDTQGAVTLARSLGLNANYAVVPQGSVIMNLYSATVRAVANNLH